MPSYVLDTNILLRSVQPTHQHHIVVQEALRVLLDGNERLATTTQNMIEFRNASTRSVEANGLGLSPVAADLQLLRFESMYEILPEDDKIYLLWKQLVSRYAVIGRQVHDARIAAAMQVHSITNILTFNGSDFSRYAGIAAVDPASV